MVYPMGQYLFCVQSNEYVVCECHAGPRVTKQQSEVNLCLAACNYFSLIKVRCADDQQTALSTYELLISSLVQQTPLIMHSILMVQSIKYWCLSVEEWLQFNRSSYEIFQFRLLETFLVEQTLLWFGVYKHIFPVPNRIAFEILNEWVNILHA